MLLVSVVFALLLYVILKIPMGQDLSALFSKTELVYRAATISLLIDSSRMKIHHQLL